MTSDLTFGDHRPVYVAEPDPTVRKVPPVLLLHEMPGLSPDALEFAQRIAKHGYRVYVPLIFGAADEDPESRWLFVKRSLSFTCDPKWSAVYHTAQRVGIVDDLLKFSREIRRREHADRIGVIGLCISGSLPLALAAEDTSVAAPVISQPAFPLVALTEQQKRAIGLSTIELAQLHKRTERGLQILGFRFEEDKISPWQRIDRLKDEFKNDFGGWAFIDGTLRAARYQGIDHEPKDAHSVLTLCYRKWELGKPEPATHYAYRQTIAFLDAKLKRHSLYKAPPALSASEPDEAKYPIGRCDAKPSAN